MEMPAKTKTLARKVGCLQSRPASQAGVLSVGANQPLTGDLAAVDANSVRGQSRNSHSPMHADRKLGSFGHENFMEPSSPNSVTLTMGKIGFNGVILIHEAN